MSKITFQQATQGYLLAAGARHLSAHTIKDYINTFTKFAKFVGDDKPFDEITRKDLERVRLCGITLPPARMRGPMIR